MTEAKQKFPPDLSDILEEQKKDVLKTINCVHVGVIESFNTEEQTASVKISLKHIERINEDGTKILKEYPILMRCPVMILHGGNSYLTMPIAKGDSCFVLFNDRDIDNWFFDGGVKVPNTNRIHDISDGLVVVGVNNLQTVISDYLANGVRLKFSDACKIDLTSGLIEAMATLFHQIGNMLVTGNITATGDVSDSNGTTPTMQDIRDAYNSHTHPGGGVPSPQM